MLTAVSLYKNSSESLSLPMNLSGDLFLKSIDGLGKKNIVSLSDLPGVPGEVFRGIRGDFRAIDIEIGYGNTFNAVQARRDELLKYIRPHKEVTLRLESDAIEDVQITGVVESFENEPFSKEPSVKATIVCSDPYFRGVAQQTRAGIAANGTYAFQNDGHIPVGFKTTGTFSAGGDFRFARQENAASYFEIMNVATATSFSWSTVPGERYISDQPTYLNPIADSLYMYVNRLTTWPILNPGANSFVVSSLAAGTSLNAFTWFHRYEGV